MHRRDFLAHAILAGAGLGVSRAANAQERVPAPPGAQSRTSNLFDMDQEAAKSVRRPPKPNASASMSGEARDELERQVRCQCGCTLDVYICRTTDFSCQVSPAMHRDIISLVEGGYSAQEILDSFVGTYGESALMAPKRQGFNLAGYLMPFAALGIGAIALSVVLRRMQQRARPAVIASHAGTSSGSADELAKLDAAIRRDD